VIGIFSYSKNRYFCEFQFKHHIRYGKNIEMKTEKYSKNIEELEKESGKNGPYTIILADDHAFFRNDLKKMLMEKDQLQVIGEAVDGLDLLHLLSKVKPRMVILDISMPNMNGIKATHRIKEQFADIDVLILTIHKDIEYFKQAMSAGADGYLLKDDVTTQLFPAIESIRQDKVYIPPFFSGEANRKEGIEWKKEEV
jgi:DNA-binding NarL/FixJ family response regulator